MALTTVVPVLPFAVPIYAKYSTPTPPPAPPTISYKRIVAFGVETTGGSVTYKPITIDNLLAGSGYASDLPNFVGIEKKFY